MDSSMTVEDRGEEHYRHKARWSANKKEDGRRDAVTSG